MKKLNLFVVIFAFISTVAHAQGVKKLWTTTGENIDPDLMPGYIITFDSVGNNYQLRHEFPNPPYSYPESLNFYNGKFYSIVGELRNIFEYDPLTEESNLIGQLEGRNFAIPSIHLMTMKNGVFYGVSSSKLYGQESDSYLFTFDPATHVFTVKYQLVGSPAGAIVEKDGKFYGMLIGALGNGDFGNIFEWDPQTNIVVKKINFPEEEKGFPTGSMILLGNKFYGLCSGGAGIAYYGGPPEDPLLNGSLFEWDPVTNDFNIKYDFEAPENGSNPIGNLVEKDGKLYGATVQGGENNAGVVFEFDPVTSTYSKKADMFSISSSGGEILATSAGNLYGKLYGESYRVFFEWNATNGQLNIKKELPLEISDLLVVSAPVSMPTPGSCVSYPVVQVDESNNNQWVALTDSKGDVLAELQPHGNNLGAINAQAYINNTGVRTDGAGRPYLDRSITITPSTQPAEGNPVDIRLYITKSEFELLKSAPSSGITGIEDIAIFKSNDPCSAGLDYALPIPTTYEDYDFGYILKASITSFSSFYFSNRSFQALPLEILAFTGDSKNNDVLLRWTTEHEYNARDFDIERSTDGSNFITAGNVAAYNTPGKHEYNFTDQNAGALTNGRLYYRIKQKDLDGKYEYSKTITVSLPVVRSFTLSPNPAQSFLEITYNGYNVHDNLKLQITDMSGKKLLEQTIIPAAKVHKINISTLSRGVYFISILNNGSRITGKFVKQ